MYGWVGGFVGGWLCGYVDGYVWVCVSVWASDPPHGMRTTRDLQTRTGVTHPGLDQSKAILNTLNPPPRRAVTAFSPSAA